MRHLLTSLALLTTFAAAGQTTNPFPYNPDVDADGWISVNDLLSLLAIFTTEFTPESWETDSLSAAVVLNGNISYFECQRACHELEGHWRMADVDAFGKHWNLVAGENANHWINSNSSLREGSLFYEINGNGSIYQVCYGDLSQGKKCMCHLQSSPFVPDVLTSETAGIQEQIDSLYAQQALLSEMFAGLDSAGGDNDLIQECTEIELELDSLLNSEAQLEAQVSQLTNALDSLNSTNNMLTSALQLQSDSIESIEIEMQALLDSVVISPQIEYLTNYCAYYPNTPNNPYRYVDQGCTLCMIRAVSSNMYGGVLRLNSDGYGEGGLMTIFYSARDGNSGTWQIETSTENGWTNITSVGPSGGDGWLGTNYLWTQTFQFNGSSWTMLE